ncbi:MAG: hypothetical protein HC888_02295 [Candidatus Competibacteraceae bacterium]|nr:hypothetical protein [Candidatus Competibacteraceae bacterium]
MWKLALRPRELTPRPEWITAPTCAGCLKVHYKALFPGHPAYPKNPRPGDMFYIDSCDVVHRFGGMTGPPSTRPHPKDIERDQKKVADYIREKQAEKDKQLEESNRLAEQLLEEEEKKRKEHEEQQKMKKGQQVV